jgi:nicotinate-nucleotide--dimethylbenzimidazole phosphoribosyltransferase|nr:nicotinate-nucleotide--dimethylbenzimidazole phosphoribosyltransferase [Puia sp.]
MQTTTSLDLELRHRIDSKTKPLGALGRLEEIALQLGLLQGTIHPRLTRPHIVVFAGDHGIAATGLVNPYPQSVTAQMVLNFIRGGAAINVFCRQHDLGLTVVDAGVNFDFDPALRGRLVSKKTGYGTRNYLEAAAMTSEEAETAIEAGKEIVAGLAGEGCNCIGLGEMGIGNTSSASLIMSYITGIPVADCTGRGTGVDDGQFEQKKNVLQQAAHYHAATIAADPGPLTILRQVGGYEIAMLTGAYLKAAELKMVILVDGFITTAALLLARLIDPRITDCCIFSHCSGEKGHAKMLEWLGVEPLLQLGMRLGEGTGAAMAYPFVQSAVNFLEEMASFESAGVSKSGEL